LGLLGIFIVCGKFEFVGDSWDDLLDFEGVEIPQFSRKILK
jgi:hypothetical protein